MTDSTRWLNDEEQRLWRSVLTANRLLFDRIERELQQDAGLPHAYFEILVHLSETPGRSLRMSDLASTALSSRSRLSHAIARMEEAGWVRRRPCPSDRRGQLAELTDAGLAKLQAAAPAHVEEVRAALFDGLTPEQLTMLREVSDAIVNHISEDDPPWPFGTDNSAAAPDAPDA